MNESSIIYFFTTVGLVLYNFISADLARDSQSSWIKGTLGGLPTEIAGNFVDRNYELIKSKLKERFPRFIRDNKETLYKSVRRSQLKAIRDVCNTYRDEIKETNSEKYNLDYINKVEDYLKIEEAKLTLGDFQDMNLDEDEIKRIMLNDEIPQNIQIDASNALIKELPKNETLPSRFVEILQNGWLFERFEVHFNVELAKPEVANVLFKGALSGIQFSLDELLAGQANQAEEIKKLRVILEKRADELERLGYRILYEGGEVKGFKLIGEILIKEISEFREENYQLHQEGKNVIREVGEELKEHVTNEINKLFEADKAFTPEERQAKLKEFGEEYISQQIKDYPVGEIVGEVYPHDKFFVDRDTEKQNLPNWLMNDEKIVVIKGISGDGKTALMTEVLRAIIAPDDSISHGKVKGILTFYFRDFSGKVLDVNLLDICKKADARLAKDGKNFGFALQYEEFRRSNPLDIPVQIIANLCNALNSLGDIWFIFDNFESALQNGRIKDAEIEAFIRSALTQNNLRILITSQVLPNIAGVSNIRQCTIADLPPDFAKKFLWSKGRALKENGTDCGLDEATSEQFDELFTKLLPSPISLISFIAYLETLCDTEGKVFADVLADETLFVGFAGFDADDKNKGARVLIRRQFELLSEIEQLVLKALSIFPKAIEFPVLQSILPLSLEKQTLLSILKSNSLVRKGGKNLYELLPLPKEVIARQFEQNETLAHKAFNFKATMFYRSVHKPVADCYTFEDFDTYFKEIEHCYQADYYEQIVRVINEILLKTNRLGMMKETLERSQKIQDKLDYNLLAKANNHFNIGVSLDNSGKLSEGIAEYDKAIKIFNDLAENQLQTEVSSNLAMAFVNRGISFKGLGKFNEALAEYDKGIVILNDLVENQGRIELTNTLANSFINKGVVFRHLRKFNESIAEFDKGIMILNDLVENQGHLELAHDLAAAYDNKGITLSTSDKLSEAIIECDKAIVIWEELVNGFGRKDQANDLAIAYSNKAATFTELGKLNEAIIELDKAIEIYKELIENQKRAELANNLASAFMNKGNALEQQNHSAEAVAMFGQAIELWEQDLQLGFVHNLPNLVKALRIRVESLIKLEDWGNIAVDGIKSFSLFTNFTQDENFSEHFKQQIGGEFYQLCFQIKQLLSDKREKIFTIANEIGQSQDEPIPFGDILRQYVEEIE